MLKKAAKPTIFYPGDANNILRPTLKPNIGHIPDCSQWINLKPATAIDNVISNPNSNLYNHTESRNLKSGQHQRYMPQIPYPNYYGQVVYT